MIKISTIKRIITITAVTLLAILCMAVVVACGNDRALQKLPTPEWPYRDGSAITWNNDPLYTDFAVSVDGTEYKTNENSFDISFAISKGKAFDVKVKALGDGKYYADSEWSRSLTVAPMSLTMELMTNKNEYQIKKCIQASGDIVLPQMYDGLPVTEIGNGAFSGCNDITSVTIPDGIKSIGSFAFRECAILERVIVGDSVEKIYNQAFALCEKLKTVNIPKYVSYIDEMIFRQSGINDLSVDADNSYYRAEGNCLIRKSDNAVVFANENSKIPSDVDAIAQYAIRSDKIETLVIPDGVKTLEKESVYFCRNLKRVQIPESVTEIEIDAFYFVYNIDKFIVDRYNPIYKSDRGHIIRKADNVLMFGCSGNIVIPDYVTGIAKGAFYGRNTQNVLFIPKGVTWIGHNCFVYCANLKYVYLPDTLTELGYAFFRETDSKGHYVSGTRSITIPEGCVSDGMGTRTYSSPDCEIGYDDGYAYVHSISYTIGGVLGVNYNLPVVINWEDYADLLPYRYGYTFGGFSAIPDGEPITTAEEIEQIAYTENNTVKVRVYPIWIANEN